MYVEHKGEEKLMSSTNEVKIIITMGGNTSSPLFDGRIYGSFCITFPFLCLVAIHAFS
jgi:hypothetical protein